MDFKKLFSPRLSIRQFFPWIIFVILCSAFLGIFLSEKFADSNKKDLEQCVLSSWSDYKGCETGDCQEIGVRTRTVIRGTDRCTNQLMVDTKPCSEVLNCADFNCQYTQWTEWSDCPDLCFHNIYDCETLPNQVRFRNVLRPALPGGQPCDWTTLIQERPCVIQGPCAPDLDCIPGPGFSCAECPDLGCTLTENPFYTLCTRTILQSQSGNGKYCSRESLLFSQSCFLPDCKDQCLGNNFGAFSRCSVPCGPGLFFSSSANDCPTLTTGECDNGSCSIGGFSLSTFTSCIGGTLCPATDLFSYTRCLARAASDPTIFTAVSVSGGLLLGSLTCVASGPDVVFTYSDYADCVPATWDMISAVCLFLCDSRNSITSLERGYFFPFEDGSVSCPIDIYMLSISNICPLVNSSPDNYGMQQFLGLSDEIKVVGTESFSCPISTDCEYQPYADAAPWGDCNRSCANGGGLRTRTRFIVKPETFLGVPCDPLLTVETLPCNLNLFTSATDMWCPSQPEKRGEYLCEYLASTSGSKSFQLLYESQTGPELFLADAIFTLNSSTLVTQVNLWESQFTTLKLASYSQLVEYFRQGGQSCLGGWIFNDQKSLNFSALEETVPRTCPSSVVIKPWIYNYVDYENGYCFYTNSIGTLISLTNMDSCTDNYVPVGDVCSRTSENACEDGFQFVDGQCRLLDSFYAPIYSYTVAASVQQSCSMMPGRNVFAGLPDSQYIWMYGKKDIYYNSLSLQPFFTPTTNSQVQSFSNVQCSLFDHRTDLVECTSLSAQTLFTHSNLIDLPCSTAKNCSLSAWTNTTKCGPCLPPITQIQTRSIISRATEGGIPCDQYLLVQNVPCPSTRECQQPGVLSACVQQPFAEISGIAADACDAFTQTYPLIENWSQDFIYQIAAINAIAKVTLYSGGPMPDDLAQALNAQVLDEFGSFSQCIQGLNASGLLTNTYTLSAASWETSSCLPNTYVGQQILQTVVGSISRRYFNGQEWVCGSTCPYIRETCDFPVPITDSCTCGINEQRLGSNRRTFSNLLTCTAANPLTFTTYPCPNEEFPCASISQCPPGCDGTPCGSQSGYGFCYYNTNDNYYECSCTNGSIQVDCSPDCKVGQDGLPCSGNGTCLPNGNCLCSDGWFGVACDQRGVPLVGAFESLLYTYSFQQIIKGAAGLGPATFSNVSAVNTLPCDDENNVACSPVRLTSNNVIFHPVFQLDTSQSLYSANICIQSGNGANLNSLFVPNHLMLYKDFQGVFPEECYNVIPGNVDPFDILCEFNDHPSVPPYLVGKRFYTRCMKRFNNLQKGAGGDVYTFTQITQGDEQGDYFTVLGTFSRLADECNSRP